jgi:hypothetical protein
VNLAATQELIRARARYYSKYASDGTVLEKIPF